MKTIKCPVCGGEHKTDDNIAELECEYCGNTIEVNPEIKEKTETAEQQRTTPQEKRDALLAILKSRINVQTIVLCAVGGCLFVGGVDALASFWRYSVFVLVILLIFVGIMLFFLLRNRALYKKYKEPFRNNYIITPECKREFKGLKYSQIRALLENLYPL